MRRFPRDLAARDLPLLAEVLREDAARSPGQRRLIGTSPRTLFLAADVLDKVALEIDPKVLFDGRHKAMPAEKAVCAVLEEAFKISEKRDATTNKRIQRGLTDRETARLPSPNRVRFEAEDWDAAIDAAAGAIERDKRTIERHFDAYLESRGLTRASYSFPGEYPRKR